MIASLQGKIIHKDNKYIVLDVSGVGYKVFLTSDAIHSLKQGFETMFWIYMVVRDDAMELYGFIEKRDKDFFELLISVSGIGPKGAQNILSLASVDTLINSIKGGSVAHLVKISGIGKKTAEKIVLELRDKLGAVDIDSVEVSGDIDVIEALKALGYSPEEARDVLRKIPKDIGTGARVKLALKELGKN
jgi:Holliday junction DNA helicase RuvA